jgi:hypothetical protein
MLMEKREGRQWDSSVDRQFRMLAECLLPQPNFFPSSLYLARGVIGCKEAADVEVHVCSDGCYAFNDLPKDEYRNHSMDVCPRCAKPRFEEKRGRLVPCSVYYDLGLVSIIRDRFFTDVEWCAQLGQGRTLADDYYTSAECSRLHQASGASLLDKATSVYEIGLDWCQVFVSKVHSMGILCIR